MTENEAKKTMEVLRHNLKVEHMTKDMWDGSTKEEVDTYIETFECYSQAIQALEENQQYRAIGTAEELQALKEKLDMKNRCKDCAGCIAWKCDCSNIRAKAIDELKNKICMHFADWQYSEDDKAIKDIIELASESVDEIAEEMKGSE